MSQWERLSQAQTRNARNRLTEAHVSDDPVPVDEGEIARMSRLVFDISSCRRYSALKDAKAEFPHTCISLVEVG